MWTTMFQEVCGWSNVPQLESGWARARIRDLSPVAFPLWCESCSTPLPSQCWLSVGVCSDAGSAVGLGARCLSSAMSGKQGDVAYSMGTGWGSPTWVETESMGRVWVNGVEGQGHSRQEKERSRGRGLYTALGSQWVDHSAYFWVFVLEAADGSAVVKVTSGFIPRRAGWQEPLGELGNWRRTFPVSLSWSFSLTTSYRPTVDGIHLPIHLSISSFHFTLFLSTGIYYVPILCEVLVK